MYFFSSFGAGRMLEKVCRLGLFSGMGMEDCEREGVVGVVGGSSKGNSFDGFAFLKANLLRRRGGGAADLWGAMTDILVSVVVVYFADALVFPIRTANVVVT